MSGRTRTLLVAGLVLRAVPGGSLPQAPGGPGEKPTWTNGNKQGIGTAAAARSKVSFTLGEGVLTEVYYPKLDKANTRLLELVVADGRSLVARESRDTGHRIEAPDPNALLFRQVNMSRTGRYRITKTTFADPERPRSPHRLPRVARDLLSVVAPGTTWRPCSTTFGMRSGGSPRTGASPSARSFPWDSASARTPRGHGARPGMCGSERRRDVKAAFNSR